MECHVMLTGNINMWALLKIAAAPRVFGLKIDVAAFVLSEALVLMCSVRDAQLPTQGALRKHGVPRHAHRKYQYVGLANNSGSERVLGSNIIETTIS